MDNLSVKLLLQNFFVLVRKHCKEGVCSDLISLCRVQNVVEVQVDPLGRVDLVEDVILDDL